MDEMRIQESVLSTSQEIGIISEALSKAQAEIEMSEKDATNPHFKSLYSTLSSSIKAGKPAATRNGLAVVQASGFTAGIVTVTTLLTHKSNQWLKNVLSLPVHKTDIHTIKSAITYGRRIGYDGILGIAPGDSDDDGNAGAAPPTAEEKKNQTAARKLRAKMNKAFSECQDMKQLEDRARDFKKNTYGFWDMATFVNEGETFGKLYLTHKDRIGNTEARYNEQGQIDWRNMLSDIKDAAEFTTVLKNYQSDLNRQTQENEVALQVVAQDLGLWDEHTQKFMVGD